MSTCVLLPPSLSTPSLSTFSQSYFPKIPVDLLEVMLEHLFDIQVDSYDELLLETLKNVSLVNSTFLYFARKHSPLFHTKMFYSLSKIKGFLRLIKEYPKSTIPSHVKILNINMINEEGGDLGECEECDVVSSTGTGGGCMYESTLTLFLTQELFPNVEELFVIGPDAPRMTPTDSQGQRHVVNALRGIIASPSLRRLHFLQLLFPADIFSHRKITLKELELWLVKVPEGCISFPATLEKLQLSNGHELDLALKAIDDDSEIFAHVKELSLREYTAKEWNKAWMIICSLKNSLRRLELSPSLWYEELDDPLDILMLENLEVLSLMVFLEFKNEYRSIQWLSQVFSFFKHRPSYKPTFTLQLLVMVTTVKQIVGLASVDEWIKNFLPSTLSFHVMIHIYPNVPMDSEYEQRARKGMQYCDKRGVLNVERYEYED
ncbi:hypothetical protein BDQ17DRAFT_1326138 [Cyathus striatus]|nr:hypothetical protein BDQ17DRAFT_1326138 [Cyathus striatus]